MRIRLILSSLVFLFSLSSCDHDDEKAIYPNPAANKSDLPGRFDDTTFKWDYIHSNNSDVENEIFIGDLNIDVIRFNPRDIWHTSSGRRQSSGTSQKGSSSTDNLMIFNPVTIYVGAPYPKSSFCKYFDKEIGDARNPIDIVFNFPNRFIRKVTQKKGSVGYLQSLKEAIVSDEFKEMINSSAKERVDYYLTEYYTDRDIEKAFYGKATMAKVFSSEVKKNSKNTKTKSRLLAQLVNRHFTVYMDLPEEDGFFIDKTLNSSNSFADDDLPVYVKSLTYGKATFLAIESEYSFSEVKQAFETAAGYKFSSAEMKKDKEITEIFSKSSITILTINDRAEGGINFMDGIEKLNDLFTVQYSKVSYGYLVFCQSRYIHNNEAFIPIRNSENNNSARRKVE